MQRAARKLLFVLSLFLPTILMTVPSAGTAAAGNSRDFVGAVYTMTNDTSGNALILYRRTAHGLLVPGGTFSTGGLGSGDGLGNQGALALSAGNRPINSLTGLCRNRPMWPPSFVWSPLSPRTRDASLPGINPLAEKDPGQGEVHFNNFFSLSTLTFDVHVEFWVHPFPSRVYSCRKAA
jgi:hypothetical protein